MVTQSESQATDEATPAATLITLTPTAAEQVKRVLAERTLSHAALRVFIAGRTCSGFQYGLAPADGPDDDDIVVEQHGVRLIVDQVSAPFLSGAIVDYHTSELQQGFTIQNPSANTGGGGCACGGGGCGCAAR